MLRPIGQTLHNRQAQLTMVLVTIRRRMGKWLGSADYCSIDSGRLQTIVIRRDPLGRDQKKRHWSCSAYNTHSRRMELHRV